MLRREMLGSVPHRNPAVKWNELDSDRILAVYEKAGSRLTRRFRKLFAVPEVSELLLDAIGSKVVRQIDGTRTVGDLIGYVSREFKLSRKEAEVALLKFMDTLARRRLVGFEIRPSMDGR